MSRRFRRVLLVTPKIVSHEKEQQRIMLGGVTPRIIIQEEEEELLGILVE